MPIPLCVNPRSSTSVSRRRPIVEPTDLPTVSRLRSSFGRADFADAFSVELPQAACGNAEALARHVFEQQPGWIAKLLSIRDRLVQPIGLKRVADLRSGEGERISIFRVFERYPYEIILGEDDLHLDFRLSVLVQPASGGGPSRLIVTTLVFYNRLLGRAYIALISPFHRLVVRASLDQAQKRGWPSNCDRPAAAPSAISEANASNALD